MLTLIILLARLTAPSPELTIEQMEDFQAHAEATLRLQAGIVEPASYPVPRFVSECKEDGDCEEWAFLTMDHQPELDLELASIGTRVSPFASDEQGSPFAQ
jgi:hypothetical protein